MKPRKAYVTVLEVDNKVDKFVLNFAILCLIVMHLLRTSCDIFFKIIFQAMKNYSSYFET